MNKSLPPIAERMKALSLLYHQLGEVELSIDATLIPAALGDKESLLFRANMLHFAGQDAAAAEILDQILVSITDPDEYLHVGSMAATLRFKMGEFRKAKDIASRFRQANIHPNLPAWEGQDLRGKTVLAWCGVNGLGDHIMYARNLHHLAQRGATVIVQSPKPLSRLFAAQAGVAGCVPIEAQPVCDFAVTLSRCSLYFPLHSEPYIRAPAFRPNPRQYHVGIVWGCSWAHPYADRSCALAELHPLVDIPGIKLYSLQKGAHAKQLLRPPAGMDAIVNLGDGFRDFYDTACAVASMDAIVTTDTAVANLAAAMGKPTFVLLPYHPDFRWGSSAPWYPAARCYEQRVRGEWNEPIAKLSADLRGFLHDLRKIKASEGQQ